MKLPTVTDFRAFANNIRQPSRYCPVVTELKGITNLVFGALELLVSQYMKYSSNPRLNHISAGHVKFGQDTFKTGFFQAVPGLLFGVSAVCLYRKMKPHLEI